MHLVTLAAAMAVTTALSSPPPCQLGPLPAALDSVARPAIASEVIEFAATPALDYPGGAWITRLYRGGTVSATMEVIRLRRQADCNRYLVEQRWAFPLRQDEYQSLADRIAPFGRPPPKLLSQDRRSDVVVLDGTGLDLRLRTTNWQVTRTLNHYTPDGAALSSVFHGILARYVPAAQLPAEDWRRRPAR